jgi:acyl carrier protein
VTSIKDTVKSYILQEFLPGEDSEALTDDVELIKSGILDSLATLKLVTYLEEQYEIELEAHETDEEHLGTLLAIESLVQSKQ